MRNTKMWKRFAALVISSALLLSPTSVYAEEGNVTEPEKSSAVSEMRGQEAVLTISSVSELNEFAQEVNNGNTYAGKLIELTQDIQFDGVTANNFTPIGFDDKNRFEGIFEGNGHTISGINITGVSYSDVGLFGVIGNDGIVNNVSVKDSRFTARYRAGGIAGYNWGIIDNCHNKNTTIETAETSGGIAGKNEGTILNSTSSGELSGDFLYAGGIAGNNTGKIYNSCNTGNILAQIEDAYTFAKNAKSGVCGIGGITGGGLSSCIIENCYNIGNIITEQDVPYGGIASCVGSLNDGIGVAANSFCSEDSASGLICFVLGNGIERNNKALPAEEMKTDSFTDQLNTNRGSNTGWLEWEIRTGESSYPLPVERIDLSECQINLRNTSIVYSGSAKTPKVTVSCNGRTLLEGTDYTAEYIDNINAGTAQINITGKGLYMGTAKKNFTIQKAAQKFSYTKSYTKVYGNKAFLLNKKLKTGNGKLTYTSSNKKTAVVGSNGRVTIKGTGTAVITIKASGTSNYKAASVKVTIKVNPVKQTITSVTSIKGRKIIVKWKKDTRATGYQIQYSADQKFKKGVKSAAPVSKNTTTSKTLSKLKRGKKYYVRVRSYKTVKVNGTTQKLYGRWSSVKRSGSIKK